MANFNPIKRIILQLLIPAGLSLTLFACSEKQPEQQGICIEIITKPSTNTCYHRITAASVQSFLFFDHIAKVLNKWITC